MIIITGIDNAFFLGYIFNINKYYLKGYMIRYVLRSAYHIPLNF